MISNWIKDDLVKKLCPDLKPYGGLAIDHFLLSNPSYTPQGALDRYLFESIQRIATDLIAIKAEGIKEGRARVRPRPEYSTDNLERSDKALEQILPEIEKIRREIFGKDTAPFKTSGSARRWLAKESREEEASFFREKGDTGPCVRELEGQIERLLNERNALSPGRWTLKRHRVVPVSLGQYYPTFPGTKLRTLGDSVALFSEASQFNMQSLFAFIFTGIKPIRRLMDISFLGPVTLRDFLDYYKRLPVEYKNSKKVTQKNAEVYHFVKNLGGPPREKIMAFWRTATAEWNAQPKTQKFGSRDGLKKAYERAARKLGPSN